MFALAAGVVEHAFGGDREPFRRQLIKAIATEPCRPYWRLERAPGWLPPDLAAHP